ncbi:hypothetical protein ACJIZ3_020193 [Penstemon smallii]|uniref:CCHC-type domain-containing protein n=1 Tax=Penstemon smallii TaxID=265156 RepID=A0ABD3SHX4_9LAMI
MCSVWSSSFRVMVPKWRHSQKNFLYLILPHSNRKLSFFSSPISSSSTSDDNSAFPKQSHLGYDPSEDLFGLAVDLQPRKVASSASKPRSWFGPNGQYIRELPCPSCRGRGYTPCTECGIERSRSDCSLCNGKGMVTCHKCLGDCVVWEESIDEQPWEKARSMKRKTKRVHQTSDPEVNLKISRSLKILNARTGIFSKRMKIIHGDPMLHAQRVAAIKKSKGTAAARKHASEAMKSYFSDPDNRLKRSIAMRGVKFYCRNCGKEGHRRNYCPEVEKNELDRRFKCRLCGEKGHNRRTCQISKSIDEKSTIHHRNHHCKVCGKRGHNKRTCPQLVEEEESTTIVNEGDNILSKRNYRCCFCREEGHNIRTCPHKK